MLHSKHFPVTCVNVAANEIGDVHCARLIYSDTVIAHPHRRWIFVPGVGSEIICYLLKDDDIKSTLTEMRPRRIEFIVMFFSPLSVHFCNKNCMLQMWIVWTGACVCLRSAEWLFYPLRKSISHGFHQAWKRTIIECKIDRWSKICLFCWC